VVFKVIKVKEEKKDNLVIEENQENLVNLDIWVH